MLGTLVNVAAIIAGSLVGLIFRGRISEKYIKPLIQAVSLGVILIGLKSAFKCNDFILIIISLALGTLLGELCKIEHRLENVGAWIENKFLKKGGTFAEGFVTTSLLYCVGAMAIVGSLESALTGNHSTLFAKSTFDGLVAVAHMLQNPDFEERWMSATNEEQLRDVNLLIGLIALDAYNLRQKAPYWTEVAGRRFDR